MTIAHIRAEAGFPINYSMREIFFYFIVVECDITYTLRQAKVTGVVKMEPRTKFFLETKNMKYKHNKILKRHPYRIKLQSS